MPSTRFQAALPADAVKGAGTRTNIVSFLAMARNPLTVPVYKTEPFDLGCRLTGFEVPPKDELEIYSHAISFLDRIIQESSQHNLNLEDRLDAQGLLWCVTKYAPPEAWPDEEKQAFIEWREGRKSVVVTHHRGSQRIGRQAICWKSTACRRSSDCSSPKARLFFTAPPGTGKTYVATRDRQILRRRRRIRHRPVPPIVYVRGLC